MREDQKKEVEKLLWCFMTTPSEEIPSRAKKLNEYLCGEKIPLYKLKHAFKDCKETHLRAIAAVSKLATDSLQYRRGNLAA